MAELALSMRAEVASPRCACMDIIVRFPTVTSHVTLASAHTSFLLCAIVLLFVRGHFVLPSQKQTGSTAPSLSLYICGTNHVFLRKIHVTHMIRAVSCVERNMDPTDSAESFKEALAKHA